MQQINRDFPRKIRKQRKINGRADFRLRPCHTVVSLPRRK
jgi:hypothetical protein